MIEKIKNMLLLLNFRPDSNTKNTLPSISNIERTFTFTSPMLPEGRKTIKNMKKAIDN